MKITVEFGEKVDHGLSSLEFAFDQTILIAILHHCELSVQKILSALLFCPQAQ
jgi:hypothetical protein